MFLTLNYAWQKGKTAPLAKEAEVLQIVLTMSHLRHAVGAASQLR